MPLPSWDESVTEVPSPSTVPSQEMTEDSNQDEWSDVRTAWWVAHLPESCADDAENNMDETGISESADKHVGNVESHRRQESEDRGIMHETPTCGGHGSGMDGLDMELGSDDSYSVIVCQDSDQSSDTTTVDSFVEDVMAPEEAFYNALLTLPVSESEPATAIDLPSVSVDVRRGGGGGFVPGWIDLSNRLTGSFR